MKAIKAVFFDIGGVLLEIDWRRTLQHLEIKDPNQQLKLSQKFSNWQAHHAYERGHITDDEFLSSSLEFFSEELGANHISRLHMREAWQALIVGPIAGIEAVLASVNVPIYTLSNTNTLHFNEFSKHPFFKHFNALYTSFNLNERKPDRAIYEKAAAEVGFDPSECLFIDDLNENLEAARRVGFCAEHSENSSARTAEILKKYRVLKS